MQMALKLLRWPIHCKMPYPLSPQDACKVCLDLENGPFGREYSAYHSLGALHFPAVRMEGIPFVEKFGEQWVPSGSLHSMGMPTFGCTAF